MLRALDIDEIERSDIQSRTDFDEDRLDDLAESIKSVGVIQPVVVRHLERQRDGERGGGGSQ